MWIYELCAIVVEVEKTGEGGRRRVDFDFTFLLWPSF